MGAYAIKESTRGVHTTAAVCTRRPGRVRVRSMYTCVRIKTRITHTPGHGGTRDFLRSLSKNPDDALRHATATAPLTDGRQRKFSRALVVPDTAAALGKAFASPVPPAARPPGDPPSRRAGLAPRRDVFQDKWSVTGHRLRYSSLFLSLLCR